MSFENLNLHPLIIKAINDSGYTSPTPIQKQAIPELLAGHDIMASAQTGTGKTAAFMLPALHHLATPSKFNSHGPRILVLTPTRELALQVSNAANKYGKYLNNLKTVSILGGMPYPLQNKLLSKSVDILVATPGRLIDHIQRGRINFTRLEILVLDEADRMLDMGFIEDVEKIASEIPKDHQTLLFSATLDNTITKVAKRLLSSPKRIQIATQQTRLNNIEQRLHYVDNLSHKNKLLDHLLNDINLKQAIVFTATKRDADALADNLSSQGHIASALHGDMNQRERNRTLSKLRHGRLKILVATDVAARGIDIVGITHVINFDLPKFAEDYVHRIGRTGRAGASGIAVSFASGKDNIHLKRIERFTGHRIASHVIPGLEPRHKSHFDNNGKSKAAPAISRKRKRSYSWSNENGSRNISRPDKTNISDREHLWSHNLDNRNLSNINGNQYYSHNNTWKNTNRNYRNTKRNEYNTGSWKNDNENRNFSNVNGNRYNYKSDPWISDRNIENYNGNTNEYFGKNRRYSPNNSKRNTIKNRNLIPYPKQK